MPEVTELRLALHSSPFRARLLPHRRGLAPAAPPAGGHRCRRRARAGRFPLPRHRWPRSPFTHKEADSELPKWHRTCLQRAVRSHKADLNHFLLLLADISNFVTDSKTVSQWTPQASDTLTVGCHGEHRGAETQRGFSLWNRHPMAVGTQRPAEAVPCTRSPGPFSPRAPVLTSCGTMLFICEPGY